MFGLLLIVAQFAQIFAESKCVFGDSVCWISYANNVIVPKLSDGIPELGIERLDKMQLRDIDIDNGETILKLTNVTLSGFKNSIIEDTKLYVDLKILRIVFNTNLTLAGGYNIKNKFFTIPLSGNGQLTLSLKNVHVEMLMSYDIIKDENEKIIFVFKNLQKSFHSYGGIHFNFENNDKDHKDFDEKLDVLLNENWRVFEGYGAEIWTEFTEQIFNAIKLFMANLKVKYKM